MATIDDINMLVYISSLFHHYQLHSSTSSSAAPSFHPCGTELAQLLELHRSSHQPKESHHHGTNIQKPQKKSNKRKKPRSTEIESTILDPLEGTAKTRLFHEGEVRESTREGDRVAHLLGRCETLIDSMLLINTP